MNFSLLNRDRSGLDRESPLFMDVARQGSKATIQLPSNADEQELESIYRRNRQLIKHLRQKLTKQQLDVKSTRVELHRVLYLYDCAVVTAIGAGEGAVTLKQDLLRRLALKKRDLLEHDIDSFMVYYTYSKNLEK